MSHLVIIDAEMDATLRIKVDKKLWGLVVKVRFGLMFAMGLSFI